MNLLCAGFYVNVINHSILAYYANGFAGSPITFYVFGGLIWETGGAMKSLLTNEYGIAVDN
jgi:hypothetical protein